MLLEYCHDVHVRYFHTLMIIIIIIKIIIVEFEAGVALSGLILS